MNRCCMMSLIRLLCLNSRKAYGVWGKSSWGQGEISRVRRGYTIPPPPSPMAPPETHVKLIISCYLNSTSPLPTPACSLPTVQILLHRICLLIPGQVCNEMGGICILLLPGGELTLWDAGGWFGSSTASDLCPDICLSYGSSIYNKGWAIQSKYHQNLFNYNYYPKYRLQYFFLTIARLELAKIVFFRHKLLIQYVASYSHVLVIHSICIASQ